MTAAAALLAMGALLLLFAVLAAVAELLERHGVDGYRLCRRMGLGSHLYPERDDELQRAIDDLDLRPAPYDYEHDGL
jgi:hypothetical protein